MNPDVVWISMMDVGVYGARRTSDSGIEEDKRDLKPVYEHDLFCGVSDLVWAGISYDGSTDLYVIRHARI